MFNRKESSGNKTIKIKNKVKLTRITALFLATASLVTLLLATSINEEDPNLTTNLEDYAKEDADNSKEKYEYWMRVYNFSLEEFDEKITALYDGFISYNGNKNKTVKRKYRKI